MAEKRPTVGKIVSDLAQKPVMMYSVVELAKEGLKDYFGELVKCVGDGKKVFPSSDFFIQVHERAEKVLQMTFRHQFEARLTCPTPNYDQSIFKYHWKDENLEYIWTIPSRDACHYLKNNALEVVPEEKQLLNFVLAFADGSLFKRMKELNGEKPDSIELIKEE